MPERNPSIKRELLPKLVCPFCRTQGLSLDADPAAGEIEDASLACRGCRQTFPVRGGIPRLLTGQESQPTRQAFSQQWQFRFQGRFEKPDRVFWLQHGQVLGHLRQQLSAESWVTGEWMLDAGCGSGEKAVLLAQAYPDLQVVAMDLADTLAPVQAQARQLPNLHVVQADVMHPPLAAGGFQRIFSIGVLHHTPDPSAAFAALASLVAPQGCLLLWLYPHPQESPWFQRFYYQIRDRLFLGRGHLLPPRLRLGLIRLLCLPVFLLFPFFLFSRAINRHFYQHLSFSDLYRGLVFILYDDISPPYQFRLRQAEVAAWFTAAGFEAPSQPEMGLYLGHKARQTAPASLG